MDLMNPTQQNKFGIVSDFQKFSRKPSCMGIAALYSTNFLINICYFGILILSICYEDNIELKKYLFISYFGEVIYTYEIDIIKNNKCRIFVQRYKQKAKWNTEISLWKQSYF